MSRHDSCPASSQSKRRGKVYKYYRLSLDDENAIESNSITNQRQIVEGYLATIPELADMPSVEVVDDGYTGTNFNRPGITKILDAARRGDVACIIVKDLSRFGRKYLEVSRYIEQLFPYLDIRFIAVGDSYDSDTHKGTTANLDIPVRNMLNALYSKNVSKTVKAAKRSQAQQGKYIHSAAPFGYKKDPADKHRIIIDEPAAETVRRVFELICADKTPKQIADLLNSEGILTPSEYKRKNNTKRNSMGITGSLWRYSTINSLLNNEQYTGAFVSGKVESGELGTGKRIYRPADEWIRIENNHSAIITQEVWDTAMSKRGKRDSKPGKPNTERILYKRVRCGYCGHVMLYRRGSYICRTYRYTDEHGCTGTKYNENEIADVVKTVVQSNIAIMVDLQRLSSTMLRVSRQTTIMSQNTTEGIKGEIGQLQVAKRNLYERYKKGSLDKDTYFKEREAAENKLCDKTAELESLTSQNDSQAEVLGEAKYFLDSFTSFNVDDEPSAEIVNALVDTVNVYAKDRIEVCFAFADKLEKALHSLNQSISK